MPKGCMLSHDNLTWEPQPLVRGLKEKAPDFVMVKHRFVSYLPLSHIAGLAVDVLGHLCNGHELYFAKPDALSGTLLQTLLWARPTVFFAVPRIWEKFEDKLKEVGQSKPAIIRSIATWAKS